MFQGKQEPPRTIMGRSLAKYRGTTGMFSSLDVLPDIEFGPVGKRENPNALALVDATVVEVPEFGTLVLGVPLAVLVAKGKNPFLRSRFLLITAGASERCVESAFC